MKPTTLRSLTFALLAVSGYAQLTPGNGTGLAVDANTVALFHFEDSASTALDSSGSNRNATATNTTVGTGLFGSGRVFNGVGNDSTPGDRLEFGSIFTALNGSTGWTIEYFAKAATPASNAPSFENANTRAGWYFVPSDGSISYGIKTTAVGDSSWVVFTSVTSPAMDTDWHYYALTWAQGGALSVYRDGTFLGSTSAPGGWSGSNDYGVYLDYSSYWHLYYGAGTVDDIRFSNIARSAGEIQTAYNLAAVPEPATYAMLAGLGALGLALWRRRVRILGRHS